MSLVIGTAGLSVVILLVALNSTQSIAESTRYQMFEWEEEQDDGEGDQDAQDHPATAEDGLLPDLTDPDTGAPVALAGPLVLTVPLDETTATLTVELDGTHRLTVRHGLTQEAAQDQLQAWAAANGIAPFSFTDWQPHAPA